MAKSNSYISQLLNNSKKAENSSKSKSNESNDDNKNVINLQNSYSFKPILNDVSSITFKSQHTLNRLKSVKINELAFAEETQIELEKLRFLFSNFEGFNHVDSYDFTLKNGTYRLSSIPIYNRIKMNLGEKQTAEVRHQLQNNTSIINALILYNYEIAQEFDETATFIDFFYILHRDEDKKEMTLDYKLYISPERLANYLYKKIYKHYAILSSTQSSSSNPIYYIYHVDKKRWSVNGKGNLTAILSKHFDYLGNFFCFADIDTARKKFLPSVFNKFEMTDDSDGNMLNTYTHNHPYLVQFQDKVYDMENDELLDMKHEYKLQNHHNYELGYFDENGNKLSMEQLEEKCSTLLERFKILHYEEDMTFILTLIGSLFCHSDVWQVLPIITGGGGLGKSLLYDKIIAQNVIGAKNYSSLGQQELDAKKSNSSFLLSSIYGTELNIVAETNGSYLSTSLIQTFKKIGDSITIDRKFEKPFTANLYSTFILLGNDGQIPHIPSSSADDDGLMRRTFIVECRHKRTKVEYEQKNGQSIIDAFPLDKLKSEIPYFALYCMKTFMANRHHIYELANIGGATERVIEGFTSKNIVKATKDYFNSHNRNKEFLVWLGHYYVNRFPNNETRNTTHFEKWLSSLKATEVKEMYVWFFKKNYPNSHATQQDLETYLRSKHDIKSQSLKSSLNKNEGKARRYGDKFADLVQSVILTTDPELIRFEKSYSDDTPTDILEDIF